MGHLINPVNFRLSKNRFWVSNWNFYNKKNYKKYFFEDYNSLNIIKWLVNLINYRKLGFQILDVNFIKCYKWMICNISIIKNDDFIIESLKDPDIVFKKSIYDLKKKVKIECLYNYYEYLISKIGSKKKLFDLGLNTKKRREKVGNINLWVYFKNINFIEVNYRRLFRKSKLINFYKKKKKVKFFFNNFKYQKKYYKILYKKSLIYWNFQNLTNTRNFLLGYKYNYWKIKYKKILKNIYIIRKKRKYKWLLKLNYFLKLRKKKIIFLKKKNKFFFFKKNKQYNKIFTFTNNLAFLNRYFRIKKLNINIQQKNLDKNKILYTKMFIFIFKKYIEYFLNNIFNIKYPIINFFEKYSYRLSTKYLKRFIKFEIYKKGYRVNHIINVIKRDLLLNTSIVGFKLGFFGRYQKRLRNKDFYKRYGALSPSHINSLISYENFVILLRQGIAGIELSILKKMKKNEIF